MQEIELKFQIPAGQLEAVRQALHVLSGGGRPAAAPNALRLARIAMLASYFDTPDRALARNKMALRVRCEGEDWVQTFKAAGADAMSRVEDNQPLPAPPCAPVMADLSLHTAPAARQALGQALPWRPDADPTGVQCGLQVLYETRFQREQLEVDTGNGRVAICLDEGELVAGTLREPLAELEIELIAGHPQAVIETAREWVDRHGLWLDVHSKAYRGTRLARAAAGEPSKALPVPAPATPWHGHGLGGGNASTDEARAFLAKCMEAAAGNWSEVAFLRPGWRDAAQHWHGCLLTLLQAAEHAPALQTLLTAQAWERTQALALRVQGIAPGAGHDGCAPEKARQLATAQATTHWGLDILAAIKG